MSGDYGKGALALGVLFGALMGSPAVGADLTYQGEPVVHLTFAPGDAQDLLTAGLGIAGIQGTQPVPADPSNPTTLELRRIAIYNNTRALVDVSTAGGYGRIYGPDPGDPFIYGDEFLVFADVGETRNVTQMVQVPRSFDPARPCIVTGASSGSRGVYGAIGTSGEWGLKKGCAVAYTDKGGGTGAHDLDQDTVNLIQGLRAPADEAGHRSNFTAKISERTQANFNARTPYRFAFKHAHSRDNPEALWGQHVLASIRFAFFVLNHAVRPDRFPDAHRFTPENTVVIASSVSNGGGAAVLAAEQDKGGLIDGVAVSEPNVNPVFDDRFVIVQGDGPPLEEHSRSLYDYTTLINVYQGCANLALPTAPLNLVPDDLEAARCQSLVDKGLLDGATTEEQAANAQAVINGYGILEEQNIVQPAQWFINIPQAVAVTYANAYGRFPVFRNLCGYSFGHTVQPPATGEVPPEVFQPAPLPDPLEAILFGTSSGIPPTGGVNLINNRSTGGPLENRFSVSPSTGRQDLNLDGALCLRSLELGEDPVSGEPLRRKLRHAAARVRDGIHEIRASGDLHGLPAIFVTGRSDALLQPNHTSRAYFGRNRLVEGDHSELRYIEVLNAQHLDAFIPFFPTAFIPLHHYFLEALDLMHAHLTDGADLPGSQVVRTVPRAEGEPLALDNLPMIETAPPAGDAIRFEAGEVRIPE